MSVSIESIFNKNRFPQGPGIVLVLAYIPIGVVIFILRLFISLQLFLASAILPYDTYARSLVIRSLYSTLGLVVREEGEDKKDIGCRIITTNHITPFDHLAVSLVIPCVTPKYCSVHPLLTQVLCHRTDMITTRMKIFLNVKICDICQFIASPALPNLIIRTMGMASLDKNIMVYGSWAFDLDSSAVLAVGVKVWRFPVPPIAPSVLGASWAADLCFTLFCPLTIFTVKYLLRMCARTTHSPKQFDVKLLSPLVSSIDLWINTYIVSFIKKNPGSIALVLCYNIVKELRNNIQRLLNQQQYLPGKYVKINLIHIPNRDTSISIKCDCINPFSPRFSCVIVPCGGCLGTVSPRPRDSSILYPPNLVLGLTSRETADPTKKSHDTNFYIAAPIGMPITKKLPIPITNPILIFSKNRYRLPIFQY
ncbi:unnamed protein product, partial [Meganyctiphanes norvegica]